MAVVEARRCSREPSLQTTRRDAAGVGNEVTDDDGDDAATTDTEDIFG